MTLVFIDTRKPSALRPVVLALAIAGLVGTGFAMGQAETLDTDGDGMVSYTELLIAMPDLTETEFQALDANADGMLDAEVVSAAQEAGLVAEG